jgi:hypothetical protein
MEDQDEDKNVYSDPPFLTEPIITLPNTSSIKRTHRYVPRHIRSISQTISKRFRWLIGPSRPIPDTEFQKPQPSLALSYTFSSSSHTFPLDAILTDLTRKFRLHRELYPFIVLWITANILLIRQQWYLPNTPIVIGCNTAVWDDWPIDTCGVNATGCVDLLTGSEGVYKCLGGCSTVLGNPRWIGGEEVNAVKVVIGGGDANHIYR